MDNETKKELMQSLKGLLDSIRNLRDVYNKHDEDGIHSFNLEDITPCSIDEWESRLINKIDEFKKGV